MTERDECFYCGCLIAKRRSWMEAEDDHMPVPKCKGGTMVVPACVSCHDMKDRFPLDRWPLEWRSKILEDWPELSRETRIFLARPRR
jgi:hypothetical protein